MTDYEQWLQQWKLWADQQRSLHAAAVKMVKMLKDEESMVIHPNTLRRHYVGGHHDIQHNLACASMRLMQKADSNQNIPRFLR